MRATLRVLTFLSVFSAFILLLPAYSCQRLPNLQFQDEEAKATTVINIEIPDEQYRRLQGNVRTKFSLEAPRFLLDGGETKVDDIHLRGSSSMLFRRKSLSVSLEAPVHFATGKKLDKFNLVSMCMDRSYYENVFAFRCLEKLGLFDLYHQYAEVWINDSPEGVYLITQKAADYATEERNAAYVLRRGAHDRIEDEKVSDRTSEAETAHFKAAYQQITSMAAAYQGETLYQAWQRLFDVDAYLRLLAFNYWVQNGDYADELYFYIVLEEDSPRFHIIPWDFDDIFAAAPHEGIKQKTEMIGGAMIFSSEAELDRIIATDPFLYRRYLEHLRDVLEEIPEETLRDIVQDIYIELLPYYKKPEVIEMSKYDQSRQTDLERLREDLSRSYEFMAERRRETLRGLQKKL